MSGKRGEGASFWKLIYNQSPYFVFFCSQLQGILTEIMNDVSKRKLEQRLRDRAAKR